MNYGLQPAGMWQTKTVTHTMTADGLTQASYIAKPTAVMKLIMLDKLVLVFHEMIKYTNIYLYHPKHIRSLALKTTNDL